MTTLLLDHLWQSTLFVLGVALLSLLFRKNGADVRYRLWLAASVKFLVPFSLLTFAGNQIGLGAAPGPGPGHFHRWVEVTMTPASARTTSAAPESNPGKQQEAPSANGVGTVVPPPTTEGANREFAIPGWLLPAWLAGSVFVLLLWLSRWLGLRRLVAEAKPRTDIATGFPVPVLESASSMEPGIAGIFRPVLLLPRGIAGRLSPPQLRAVLEHELVHWRRRDNLTASIHMLVEALFWFHPLVWWIGARLIREREQACDEAVLRHTHHPLDYAEGILNVCQYYCASPRPSAAISGGDLRMRIQRITANLAPEGVGMSKKLLLTGLVLAITAGPLILGGRAATQAAQPSGTLRGTDHPAVEALYQEALREREVSIMVMDPRDAGWMREAFAKTFPGVRLRVMSGLGHLPMVIADAESGRPTLDVVLTSLMEVHALGANGLLATNDWAAFDIPGSRVRLDGRFADTNNIVFTLAYDERRVGKTVAAIPTRWRDLLDPSYRGIMSTNPFVMTRISAGLGLSWGAEEAERFAQELTGSQDVLNRFGDALPMFLDENADRVFYLGMASTVTEQWESQELPTGYVMPEPVIMEQQGSAVLANAPHPSAARLLAGWLASDEARAIRSRESQSADLLPGSGDPLAQKLHARNVEIVYDTPENVAQRLRLAEAFNPIFYGPGSYNPYRRLPVSPLLLPERP